MGLISAMGGYCLVLLGVRKIFALYVLRQQLSGLRFALGGPEAGHKPTGNVHDLRRWFLATIARFHVGQLRAFLFALQFAIGHLHIPVAEKPRSMTQEDMARATLPSTAFSALGIGSNRWRNRGDLRIHQHLAHRFHLLVVRLRAHHRSSSGDPHSNRTYLPSRIWGTGSEQRRRVCSSTQVFGTRHLRASSLESTTSYPEPLLLGSNGSGLATKSLDSKPSGLAAKLSKLALEPA